MKTSSEINQSIIEHYLNDPTMNSIEEYTKVVEKIIRILYGQRAYLKNDLDKITLLGFDALILFTKLKCSTSSLLNEYELEEEYELCAKLRDISDSIKNYLYDFEA